MHSIKIKVKLIAVTNKKYKMCSHRRFKQVVLEQVEGTIECGHRQ